MQRNTVTADYLGREKATSYGAREADGGDSR